MSTFETWVVGIAIVWLVMDFLYTRHLVGRVERMEITLADLENAAGLAEEEEESEPEPTTPVADQAITAPADDEVPIGYEGDAEHEEVTPTVVLREPPAAVTVEAGPVSVIERSPDVAYPEDDHPTPTKIVPTNLHEAYGLHQEVVVWVPTSQFRLDVGGVVTAFAKSPVLLDEPTSDQHARVRLVPGKGLFIQEWPTRVMPPALTTDERSPQRLRLNFCEVAGRTSEEVLRAAMPPETVKFKPYRMLVNTPIGGEIELPGRALFRVRGVLWASGELFDRQEGDQVVTLRKTYVRQVDVVSAPVGYQPELREEMPKSRETLFRVDSTPWSKHQAAYAAAAGDSPNFKSDPIDEMVDDMKVGDVRWIDSGRFVRCGEKAALSRYAPLAPTDEVPSSLCVEIRRVDKGIEVKFWPSTAVLTNELPETAFAGGGYLQVTNPEAIAFG